MIPTIIYTVLLCTVAFLLGGVCGEARQFKQTEKAQNIARMTIENAKWMNDEWYKGLTELTTKIMELSKSISSKKKHIVTNPCVMCGNEVPEGSQVCPSCRDKVQGEK